MDGGDNLDGQPCGFGSYRAEHFHNYRGHWGHHHFLHVGGRIAVGYLDRFYTNGTVYRMRFDNPDIRCIRDRQRTARMVGVVLASRQDRDRNFQHRSDRAGNNGREDGVGDVLFHLHQHVRSDDRSAIPKYAVAS